MSNRILTVSWLSQYKDLNNRYTKVPFIRLQGKWVEKLGFTAGSKVIVEKSEGRIVLTLQKEDVENV